MSRDNLVLKLGYGLDKGNSNSGNGRGSC